MHATNVTTSVPTSTLSIPGKAVQVWNEVGALRVLHMEECGYLIHPSYMLEYMDRSLQSPPQLLFVVLDDDIPRKASQVEHEAIVQSLLEIQQKLSSLFLAQNVSSCSLDDSQEFKRENLSAEAPVETAPSVLEAGITNGSGILLPTLNGWLLGYPVVYYFKEENTSKAGRCVTSGPVQLHQVLISSTFLNSSPQKAGELTYDEDELLSFTIPNSISPLNFSEDWSQLFLQRVAISVQRASNVWTSVRMEVTTRKMESMVL
ncbi:uncharacterized protein [Physcomitrium patens]|uniref:uncharacterized protein isoform X2 n=1 Tax=Physcomitrium patens TaxID=3218 RepID=UPI000D16F01B|nr:uncharacterized protein LOC112286414 isoform X2 [Physcomitrium patens]|eukprot:XP_024384049.1 uncharacterized protein LOC112286414 isoform X2 [Physcomitrella patens]